MKYYVVRIAPFHDFYVPYQNPMTVWDVKDEMGKQLECQTGKMILIYNGKLMQNMDLVSNYGAKSGSILFLVVSGINRNKILAPKRALLEIITLATNLETMEYGIFREAMKTIRSEIDSPKIMALSMVYPTIKPTIERVHDRLKMFINP
ncbi:ubiquitin-like family [Trichomonas vaginalis G3]|nr:ubiquitin-like family [Trichomonas vaginalis G3]KAI5531506.1 ubiquitin-like family [Trichomonas vaginalis G3]